MIRRHFWYAVHNAIAHPLLLTHTALACRFHDWTADHMAVEPSADDRALWGVVASAGCLVRARMPRWTHVAAVTGSTETEAKALCARFGFDPNEMRGPRLR